MSNQDPLESITGKIAIALLYSILSSRQLKFTVNIKKVNILTRHVFVRLGLDSALKITTSKKNILK